jgi:hypothetical protein
MGELNDACTTRVVTLFNEDRLLLTGAMRLFQGTVFIFGVLVAFGIIVIYHESRRKRSIVFGED